MIGDTALLDGTVVAAAGGTEVFRGHNTVSASAAAVMAEAYGGDTTRVPRYIGFIYGTDPSPSFTDVTRDVDWGSLVEDIRSKGCNMQIVRLSRRPEVVDDDSGSHSVVFSAVTRSGAADYLGTEQDGFAGPLGGGVTDVYIYRAVLLGNSGKCGDDGNWYVVLAMVDMDKGLGYRPKPAQYELALDWKVSFK